MNLVLIGLPGSGKTTVGRAVAEALKMPFFDCDEAVEEGAGMSIPDIFTQEGEKSFRRRETVCLLKLMKEDNCVIATGGGAVEAEENRRVMQAAGVVFLDRPIKEIMLTFETEGRPMMRRHSLQQLSDARRALYLQAADFIVREDTINAATEAIVNWWREKCTF